MDSSNYDLQRLETLGFEVLPRPHPGSPGYSGLRLVLPQQTAGHDLVSLELTIFDWQGRPNISKMHASTVPDEPPSVAPGRIYLRSKFESEGTFFTFGGSLAVERLAQETIMTISSEAPLLELTSKQQTAVNLLVSESEALLGEIEVAQKWSHTELMEHLAEAGSFSVYLAVLQSLYTQYQEMIPRGGRHPELLSLLERERKWYDQSGLMWATQPDLAKLLRRIDR